MTDLAALLRLVTHTGSPQWDSVHQCWVVEVSFPPGNSANEFRRAVEQYRQERAG